jgi:hypothetical protein
MNIKYGFHGSVLSCSQIDIGRIRIRLRYACCSAVHFLFNEVKNNAGDAGQDQIDHGRQKICFADAVTGSGNRFCLKHQFRDGDDHQDGRILDVDDQFIADGRKRIADSLRHDDVHHGLAVGHAEGSGRFLLAGIHGLNAGADDFRHISTGVDGNDKHGGGQLIPMDHIQKRIVDEHRLNHHRRAAEHFHIDCSNHIKEFLEKAGSRGSGIVQLDGFEAADQKAEAETCRSTDQGDFKSSLDAEEYARPVFAEQAPHDVEKRLVVHCYSLAG